MLCFKFLIIINSVEFKIFFIVYKWKKSVRLECIIGGGGGYRVKCNKIIVKNWLRRWN